MPKILTFSWEKFTLSTQALELGSVPRKLKQRFCSHQGHGGIKREASRRARPEVPSAQNPNLTQEQWISRGLPGMGRPGPESQQSLTSLTLSVFKKTKTVMQMSLRPSTA